MTLKECYEYMGENYEEVLSRLPSEKLIQKFVLRFPEDLSYQNLHKALEEQDGKEAFRAAHTLKGVAANLGFGNLYRSSSLVTDALRDGKIEGAGRYLGQLDDDYKRVCDAIRKFQENNVGN